MVTNISEYGWTWVAAGRIDIDSVSVVGAVAATMLIRGVGFAAAVAIGMVSEVLSRASKNIVYGDNFGD